MSRDSEPRPIKRRLKLVKLPGLSRILSRSAETKGATSAPSPTCVYRFGHVEVDAAVHGLRTREGEQPLTRTEWKVLMLLIERQDQVVSREAILEAVWGPERSQEHSLLHDTISRIRHRFGAAGLHQSPIQTVHGVGYRLLDPARFASGN